MDQYLRISNPLRSYDMRRPPIRKENRAISMVQKAALAAKDLQVRFTTKHNRVTIYRIPSRFEEPGLLHRASEDGQYALCGGHYPDEPQADGHAHLVCEACHQTYCLEKVAVSVVELSDDFSVTRRTLSLNSNCRACNA